MTRSTVAAWRSILEALSVAAADKSPQVVSGAMDALKQVIELLFQVRQLGPCCLCCCSYSQTVASNAIHLHSSMPAPHVAYNGSFSAAKCNAGL